MWADKLPFERLTGAKESSKAEKEHLEGEYEDKLEKVQQLELKIKQGDPSHTGRLSDLIIDLNARTRKTERTN